MSEITKYTGFVPGLIHSGGIAVPKPFEQEIFLLYTHVAGTAYVDGIMELEPYLNVDDKLDFFREPDNPYDKYAILVKTASGNKIGYVPRKDNKVFARLMDAGKLIYGKISKKDADDSNVWLEMCIYMKDGV